jgi:pectate lyase
MLLLLACTDSKDSATLESDSLQCKLPPWISSGEEVFDGFDNDCDGAVDEGDRLNPHYEGCANGSSGGQGGEVVEVTSLEESGAGSLREALESRSYQEDGSIIPRLVRFALGGTITVTEELLINAPYLTIDGASAPDPGITLTTTNPTIMILSIYGTHDIILSHLRFIGLWEEGDAGIDGTGTLWINGNTPPDRVASNIVLDHLTGTRANDAGPDVWGEAYNITFSWNFFYLNRHPTTVSDHPAPYAVRDCVSIHHNIYTKNNERNPQLRGDSRRVDIVENIISDWGIVNDGIGLTIRAEEGEPSVSANIIGNLFFSRWNPEAAVVFGAEPGPEDDGGAKATRMGSLFLEDNILPPENIDYYSTLSEALNVPEVARRGSFETVVEFAGMLFKTEEERQLLSSQLP